MTLLEEIDNDKSAYAPLWERVMAKPKGKAAIAIRVRAKALKDIITRDQMMCDLSERQQNFLSVSLDGLKPTVKEEDEIIEACQEILNVECY